MPAGVSKAATIDSTSSIDSSSWLDYTNRKPR